MLISGLVVAGLAAVLTGCAEPSDVGTSVGAAAHEVAATTESAASNAVSGAADAYHHGRGFWGRERAEFRRDVRRDEHRDIRRDAARVARHRVNEHEGWWSRARHYWR